MRQREAQRLERRLAGSVWGKLGGHCVYQRLHSQWKAFLTAQRHRKYTNIVCTYGSALLGHFGPVTAGHANGSSQLPDMLAKTTKIQWRGANVKFDPVSFWNITCATKGSTYFQIPALKAEEFIFNLNTNSP